MEVTRIGSASANWGSGFRKEGLTVILDQLANEDEFHRDGPPEGWGRWLMNQAADAGRARGDGGAREAMGGNQSKV
jgi:hypothetical protein